MAAPIPRPMKEALVEILAQSLAGEIPGGTGRRVYGRLRFPNKATVVVGMRRVGKTTFLHQWRRERLAQGVDRRLLPFINFEDERLTGLEAAQLGFLLEEYARRVPTPDKGQRATWCFDEIQVVPGWEKFVRRLLDSGTADILASGSSAALLSREIATSLRGRAWEIPLFPFSFAEYLAHHALAAPNPPDFLDAAARAALERAFLGWLSVGGFPEAQGLDGASRAQLLRDYVDVAMLRDVVERHRVTQVVGLRALLRHLLGNAGSPFSIEKFHKALKSRGVAIGRDSLHELLSHLSDAFLVRLVWMESSSERQRMVNPRKAYPLDAGLIPIFDRSGKPNLGHALETAVLIELERRRLDCTWVKTPSGLEVDFLARGPGGQTELIQICADASDPQTAERELRALVDAGTAHPRAVKRLLVATRDGLPFELPADIIAQPAYEWMLAGPAEHPPE
ncbi:MAG: ATP-binding protein [Spirochaetes bacterium]|nr:ATP-binding protein [Spirochaetota bacterium]